MKDKSYKFNSETGALYKSERGATSPNAIMAYKLAKFYGMNVEDFIIKCKGEAK